ncbi:MAG: S-layer homology domain-containing protein [Oscillospiraceae bacterium]|nr:S-layer homology domain-containing protein [Oscillospiraceae bacterium]
MKKRILSLALCLILLISAGSVYAAGSAEDPLISISYINGTFIPRMMSAVKAMLSDAMEEHFPDKETPVSGMVTEKLPAGGSISLSTGQTLILLSGSARLDISSGDVVDATLGSVVTSGALKANHRYIVCENASAAVSILSDALVCVSASAEISGGKSSSPFTDVSEGQWWYADIIKAWENGLINGMTSSTYEPKGNLSLSQTIKLTACIHQLYHEGSITLRNSSNGPWYQSYVDYCIKQGIIPGSFGSYSQSVTRRQFVEIFHAALPESEYKVINSIPDGAIGDITAEGGWADCVYDFYRAGILTGYTAGNGYAAHDFGAESSITRAEVATIMNRMLDRGARVYFSIE